MKEYGILMSGPMVRAYLAGLKSQTRRIRGLDLINENPDAWKFRGLKLREDGSTQALFERPIRTTLSETKWVKMPYGSRGDMLWFRESWAASPLVIQYKEQKDVVYRADNWPICPYDKWRSSLLMFRWAARIVTPIVSVRVERLQDITTADVLAEGITQTEDGLWLGPLAGVPGYPWNRAELAYASLWNELNEKRGFGWDVNPYVWVIEFRRLNHAETI